MPSEEDGMLRSATHVTSTIFACVKFPFDCHCMSLLQERSWPRPFGQKCVFAHGEHDLKEPLKPPPWTQTTPGQAFLGGGSFEGINFPTQFKPVYQYYKILLIMIS